MKGGRGEGGKASHIAPPQCCRILPVLTDAESPEVSLSPLLALIVVPVFVIVIVVHLCCRARTRNEPQTSGKHRPAATHVRRCDRGEQMLCQCAPPQLARQRHHFYKSSSNSPLSSTFWHPFRLQARIGSSAGGGINELEQSIGTVNWNTQLEQLIGTLNWNIQLEQTIGTVNWNSQLEQLIGTVNCTNELHQ